MSGYLSPNHNWRHLAAVGALILAGSATAPGQTENVLHVFQSGADGYYPESYAPVLDRAGNLYGTTTYGGSGNCGTMPGYTGCGMVYQLTPSAQAGAPWNENILWDFQGGADGGFPGGLILRNGKLYGSAGTGGTGTCSGGCGYLFELVPPASLGGKWSKVAIYNFSTLNSECGITAVTPKGVFYGVGPSTNGNGSVCELQPPAAAGGSWTERTLYTFKGVRPGAATGDGSGPLGVTLGPQGELWGATLYGGFCQRFEGGSCFGTIFLLIPPTESGGAWTESVVYRFSNGDQNPTSGVVLDKNGAVYGVTYVETYRFFEGARTVISSFSDIPPNPYSPGGGVVVDAAGNVYGASAAGGVFGMGTVYKLSPPASGSGPWTQTVLHSFAGGADGWNPEGPLIFGPGGVLYGTTQIGGNQLCQFGFGGIGCGTVCRSLGSLLGGTKAQPLLSYP